MRFLSICLLVLGLATFSKGSEDKQSDSEETSVEDYDDVFEYSVEDSSLDDLEDVSQDDLKDASQDDLEDVSQDDVEDASQDNLKDASQDDLEDISQNDLEEDAKDALKNALQEAFTIWNANVKACNGDVACLAQVNNVLRPLVNEAADNGVLSVIDPCEDRVGTYEVETVDGWTIEATLPC